MAPPLSGDWDNDAHFGQIVMENLTGLEKAEEPSATDEKTYAEVGDTAEIVRPTRAVFWSSFSAFMVSVLLANLDQTIVSTALPRIASQFDVLSQAAWIATAYLLTFSGFMLVIGQLLTLVSPKNVYLGAVAVFALGSLICAVGRSFPVLVFGRAVAGCGGGGIINSIMVLLSQNSKLEERPFLFSLFGIMYALASIVGPLIGGAFTDSVSWRWCFYINLPFTGCVLVMVYFLVHAKPPISFTNTQRARWARPIRELDWLGGALCIGMVVALFLPLQWGGATMPWRSATVIALFCVSGVLIATFVVWERRQGERALLPLMMFGRRTQVGAALESFFNGMGLLTGTYYLPLWYQAQGHSAANSGIDMLPFMLSVVLSCVLSAVIIKFTQRYWHVVVISPLIMSVGSGLLSSLRDTTPNSHAIGFQILYGIGIGGAMQNLYLAVQAEWDDDPRMIPQATSVVAFAQVLGGGVGVAAAGSIFSNLLRQNMAKLAPELPAQLVAAVEESVSIINTLDPSVRPIVVDAYTRSVARMFLMGVAVGGLASLSGLIVKNRRIAATGPMAAM